MILGILFTRKCGHGAYEEGFKIQQKNEKFPEENGSKKEAMKVNRTSKAMNRKDFSFTYSLKVTSHHPIYEIK